MLKDLLSLGYSGNSVQVAILEDLQRTLDKTITKEAQVAITDTWKPETSANSKLGLLNFFKYYNVKFTHHVQVLALFEDTLNQLPTRRWNTIARDWLKVPNLGNAQLIYDYFVHNKYVMAKNQGEFDIVYIENINKNGKPLTVINPNYFNDLRLVLEWKPTPRILGCWIATTAPGVHYTQFPMNSGGAFKIVGGQHMGVWQVGKHGDHEALIQTGKQVCGHRDINKDYEYDTDIITCGWYGVNQHWGWDMPINNISNTSAGCLVGRTRQGHRDFMGLIKTDKRYQIKESYRYSTTVISANLLNLTKFNIDD
jgi:hypothetical protein